MTDINNYPSVFAVSFNGNHGDVCDLTSRIEAELNVIPCVKTGLDGVVRMEFISQSDGDSLMAAVKRAFPNSDSHNVFVGKNTPNLTYVSDEVDTHIVVSCQ